MRRYDDPVDVRRGLVGGPGGDSVEGPEQFLWRGRLWKVCDVVGHWVETGPWWQSSGVHAVLGFSEAAAGPSGPDLPGRPRQDRPAPPDLTADREVWRVEAARGRAASIGPGGGPGAGRGVFDLVFDWADGSWQLARCVD